MSSALDIRFPNNWEKKKLGDLGKLFCGQSPSVKDVNTSGIGTVYVTGPEQWDGAKIHVSKWTTDPKRVVPDGSIFITVKGAGVGKTFPGISCAIGRDVYAFKPYDIVSKKFIYWAIIFSVQDVIRHAVGDIPGISKNHILDHEIFVPLLDEQELVVAEIEKQFSRLDEAVTALKRIQANLKRYKAAVLKAAVEGKLTEKWRKEHTDVEPADQLLKRILAERRVKWEETVGAKQGLSASPGFGNGSDKGVGNKGEAGEPFASPLPQMKAKGRVGAHCVRSDDSWKKKYKEPAGPDTTNLPELPEGWVWATLGQLAWSVKDGPHYSPKYSESGIPFISGGNVRPEGIDFSSAKFITNELNDELSKRCKPEYGDLLYTKGGTTGIARINTENREFNVWVHVAVLKLVKPIEIFYLQHALNSTHCFKQSQQYTHGVGNQDLGLTRMVWITIPLPPLPEQKAILDEIDRRLSVTEELEATIETNLKRAERLRQRILQQAFAGGLG